MKTTLRRLIVIVTVILTTALMIVPTLASSRTATISETRINEAYRITNPIVRSVSNLNVDLQVGQAVISGTITLRRGGTYDFTVTLVPTITNGRSFWDATEVTVNGQSVSQTIIDQINTIINASWRNFIKTQAGTGRISSLEITETDLIITFSGR
jgi:hypothetical protein